jgi:hypothetical protein
VGRQMIIFGTNESPTFFHFRDFTIQAIDRKLFYYWLARDPLLKI